MPKIVVIGGGVGGLTVAHECVERGCEVLVLEKSAILGGKGATDLYQGMPRDHAPKNISPYYYCLIEQLKRIPTSAGKTVYDELVAMHSIVLSYGGETAVLNAGLTLPSKMRRLLKVYQFCSKFVPRKELAKLAFQLLKYIFSTSGQRRKLDQISYLDLLGFDRQHPLVKLLESIAVVDVNGSALMCLDQFSRQVLGIFNPYKLQYTANYFCKPASDSFFHPWKAHLEKLGVKFVTDDEVLKVEHADKRITKIMTTTQEFSDFDECVIATDVPGLKKLNTSSQLNLAALPTPPRCENKACGFFIAMAEMPSRHIAHAFTVFLDHPWSIVTICFTRNEFTDPRYFPDHCSVYVWVSLGGIDSKGTFTGKTLEEASIEEVLLELSEATHFSVEDRKNIIAGYWGRSVSHESNDFPPNHMTTVFTRSVNPILIENVTEYNNLFLAGEFTNTLQKSPTMEKANESGKRCSQIILRKYGIDYPVEKFQYKYLAFQSREERM